MVSEKKKSICDINNLNKCEKEKKRKNSGIIHQFFFFLYPTHELLTCHSLSLHVRYPKLTKHTHTHKHKKREWGYPSEMIQ